jgi:hypothetical protein
VPRLLDCQQKVPVPSCVKGAAIVAFTGLQVETVPGVGDAPVVGVGVRVGEVADVGVLLTAGGVSVRVGEAPAVGEFVTVGVRVLVAVGDGVVPAQQPFGMGAPSTGQSFT